MLIVIRDGEKLSQKANFIVQLLELTSNPFVFFIGRNNTTKFAERVLSNNKVELATSPSAIFAYFSLILLKSPKDLGTGLLSRLFNKPRSRTLIGNGFLSILSQALYHYFASSARANDVVGYLKKDKSPKILLIDEFLSIKTVNLKLLDCLGRIIYVSQDVASDRYGFRENKIAKVLMYKLEHDAIAAAELVVACSNRDRLKYMEMGAKKVVFYPNIYPVAEFKPDIKDYRPTLSIVSRGHWGSKLEESMDEIFKALSFINGAITVYVIGSKPKKVPKNVRLIHYSFVPSKLDYLKILSKSWMGINLGFHMAGSNERKYDYAMAGLVVFSDMIGARGDILPHEYTYVDSYDLASKIEQLLQFGKEKIMEMGEQNRKQAINLAEKQREQVLGAINSLIIPS